MYLEGELAYSIYSKAIREILKIGGQNAYIFQGGV
jgi:hypothetical protein